MATKSSSKTTSKATTTSVPKGVVNASQYQLGLSQRQAATPTVAPKTTTKTSSGTKNASSGAWYENKALTDPSSPDYAGDQAMKNLRGEGIKPTAIEEQVVEPVTETPEVPTATPIQPLETKPTQEQALANLKAGGLTGNELAMAETSLKNGYSKYQAGLTQLQGTPVATSAGDARTQMKNVLPSETDRTPDTTPAIDNFFSSDAAVQQVSQDLTDWLSPPNIRSELMKQMKSIVGQQNEIAEDKLALMDINRVMEGTEQDIRDEVTAANGFATNSQVQAMAIARNKTLLTKAAILQDNISIQQDMVANNIGLLNFEKEMASTQFQERMSALQYQQQNNQFMYNAYKDTVKTQIEALGWDGMYNAYSQDPSQLARLSKITGMTSGAMQQAATIAARQRQLDEQQQIAAINASNRSNTGGSGTGGGAVVPTDTSGKPLEYGTPEYIEALLRGTANSKTKPVAAERENLGKFQRVIYQVSDLAKTLEKTNTDPILGSLKTLNPYNFDARSVNAQINALVPNVARGVYGEVGVLTDSDIGRYLLTLPNIKSTKQQNDFVTALTLKNAQRAFEIDLTNLANSGVNVSGYVDTWKNINQQVLSLEKSLGIANESAGKTVEITPEDEAIYNGVVGGTKQGGLWNIIKSRIGFGPFNL